MIRLSACQYYLEGISEDFFWKELDKITSGQSLNPQFGYNRPLYVKSESIFVGRKAGNQFSLSLYGTINRLLRMTILCKGAVSTEGRGIRIRCCFEYPFWNLITFLVLALLVFIKFDPIPFINELPAGMVGAALYGLIVVYNLSETKREVTKQLKLIEEKAKRIAPDVLH